MKTYKLNLLSFHQVFSCTKLSVASIAAIVLFFWLPCKNAFGGGSPTIDYMTTWWPPSSTYYLGGDPYMYMLGSAKSYYLSDGTSWQSGAGSVYISKPTLNHTEISGTNISYFFNAPFNNILYRQTDYDGIGNHSAQGTLAPAGPLVIQATIGSNTGVMIGQALLVSNDTTSEPGFNYYSAPVGSIVPFEVTYTLLNGTVFNQSLFNSTFVYRYEGLVDFSHFTPEPATLLLLGLGAVMLRRKW
jgi:hypothetical protein